MSPVAGFAIRRDSTVVEISRNTSTLTHPHVRRSVQLGMKRKFHVTLLRPEEGVSINCPELPGCHSQGATVEEAMENIQDAIHGYLELYGEPDVRCEVRELEVTA